VLSLLGLAIVSLMAFLTSQLQSLPLDLITTRELQEMHNTLFARFMVIVSLLGYMPWAAFTLGGGVLLAGVLLGWKESAYLRRFGILACAWTIARDLAQLQPRRFNMTVDGRQVQVRASEILAAASSSRSG
jgi:hypothetical protein